MHPPEHDVDGCVSTSAFLPAVDNSLVVAISCEWHAGLVESEQYVN